MEGKFCSSLGPPAHHLGTARRRAADWWEGLSAFPTQAWWEGIAVDGRAAGGTMHSVLGMKLLAWDRLSSAPVWQGGRISAGQCSSSPGLEAVPGNQHLVQVCSGSKTPEGRPRGTVLPPQEQDSWA